MMLFDPHIHMTSRTTMDYEAMAAAGIAAVVEPSFWVGQPRTHVGTFEDYFGMLLGWERFRASQFGMRHFCTLSLNPKEANNPRVAQGVIDLLVRYLGQGRRCSGRRNRLRRHDARGRKVLRGSARAGPPL